MLPNDGEPPEAGSPQTARAWTATPIEDRELPDHPRVSAYEASTRIARDARYVRARLAAIRVIQLAHHLADDDMPVTSLGDPMWDVRGQSRRREAFGHPHPADFRGGLPVPREYPSLFPVRLEIRHHVI